MERITLLKLRLATKRLLEQAKDFDDLFFGVQDLESLIEEQYQEHKKPVEGYVDTYVGPTGPSKHKHKHSKKQSE